MKKSVSLLLMLLLCGGYMQASKITYYIDAKHANANDNNWGDSPDQPWKTLNVQAWTDDCVIMIADGVYDWTEMGLIRAVINNHIDIVGESKEGTILQGESDRDFGFGINTNRFFKIANGATVSFSHITVKNIIFDGKSGMEEGTTHAYGGAFEMEANTTLNLRHVSIENVQIHGNNINSWGGAVMNRGILNADSCTFANCYASQGGVFFMTSGSTTNLTNCRITGNGNPGSDDYLTYRFGGAFVLSQDPVVRIDKCYFENNFTEGSNAAGGVFMLRWGGDQMKMNLDVTNSVFVNNRADAAGAILSTQAEATATATTEMNISFSNCVFYKNQGCLKQTGYNNTISMPANNIYQGTGKLVFVNNTLFGNFNSGTTGQTTNVRSIGLGDNYMKYYFINNLMNDNETDSGQNMNGVYGLVLEGTHNVAPSRLTTFEMKGNVFNATGGAFSSINYPELSRDICPECKNITGNRMSHSQIQTELEFPEIGLPFLPFTSYEDSVSVALNNGVNEYILDGRNIVPQTDINGTAIVGGFRDAGAWEMDGGSSGIPFTETMSGDVSITTLFKDQLFLNGEVESIMIYSINGACVLQKQRLGSEVNTSALSPGTYVIKIIKDGKVIINKALKR